MSIDKRVIYGLRTFVFVICISVAMQAHAQEKKTVSFDAKAAGNKYTQQYAIDVGDAPDHQLRLFELIRNYGENGPVIEGVHLKQATIRGTTDYTDMNGLGSSYVIYEMDSGERIYANGHFLAHKTTGAGPESAKNAYKNLTELTVTGGTGRFIGIRGIVRAETVADVTINYNQNHTEIEYWFEK
jgi:hypothetical protein